MALIIMKVDQNSFVPQPDFEFKKTHFDVMDQSPLSAVFVAKHGIDIAMIK
jgi:hypothetical protein